MYEVSVCESRIRDPRHNRRSEYTIVTKTPVATHAYLPNPKVRPKGRTHSTKIPNMYLHERNPLNYNNLP